MILELTPNFDKVYGPSLTSSAAARGLKSRRGR